MKMLEYIRYNIIFFIYNTELDKRIVCIINEIPIYTY